VKVLFFPFSKKYSIFRTWVHKFSKILEEISKFYCQKSNIKHTQNSGVAIQNFNTSNLGKPDIIIIKLKIYNLWIEAEILNFKRLGQYVDLVGFMRKKHLKAHSRHNFPCLLQPYYKYGQLTFSYKLLTFNISSNRADPVGLLIRLFWVFFQGANLPLHLRINHHLELWCRCYTE
jgi:hypothetical protein